MKVLLVDDSALVRERLTAMLADLAGVDVVGQAQNLSAAVEAVRTLSPDVVILDIHMPEGSGIEVLRALKKSQPAPLVIMLTNYPFLQFRQRCLAEGADFFLDKSTEFEKVPGLLEDLQQRSAPPAESISISKQAEKTSDPQELKEADPRYQSLFESLPLGLCLITPAGHILDANPALVRLLGYPDQETLLAVNAASLYVDPEERQRWQDLVEREGVVQNFAMQLCRYDGTLIWVQHSTRAIRDAAGQVLYYEAAAENITARKRAEEALAERTRLAELGAEVGAALTQSDDLRSALHRCVEAMVQHLDAAFARIWTLNPAQNVLELQASAGLYTHLDGPHSRVPVGQFKIGLIAQERQPHLTNAVIGDPGVSDQEWAKREGMVAFAGYPLIVEAHLVGVVAMFARQPLTEFTLKALAAVADEIALGIERKQAEEALRANERRFRALIENSSDTIALVTSDGTIVYTSPSVRRVLGYTEHELIGSSAFALIHPEEREYTRGLLAELLQNSGDTIIAQVRVQHKNGLWQWIEAVGQNLLAEPSVQAVVINYRDISERKQAEELLRHAEARYRSIFEHVVEGIFQTTPDGRFLTANPAMARILGYESPADLLENVSDIGQQVYAEPARRTEFQRILSEAGVVQGFEARFYRKDRSLIWTSLSAHAVRDASGALLYYEGTIEDVTARKQAEEALQVEAQISAALARVGQELIASFDKPTMLERLCQLITEVLDCDQSSTILWQPRDGVYVLAANYGHVTEQVETLRSLRVSPQVAAWLTTRLEEQEVVEVETATVPDFVARTLLQQVGTTALLYITLRRGGKFIGVQTAAYRGRRGFSAAQQRIARGIAHLASFALDNAQLLEQAESVNRLKSDFLTTMSHELSTPLNIVIGYTELLLEETFGPVPPEQADSLQRVRKAAHEELELITAMLEVSRLEADRVLMEKREVNIVELVAELRQETEKSVREKPGLSVEWQVAPGLPSLWTDRMKLKIVLKNLLSNAVKFTGEGTVMVDVSARDGGIEIRVTDTGLGVEPEMLSVIFQMFQQGDSLATRHFGGVGLGLYVVKQVLELLGGTVTVESEVGKGSTFRVWIPSLVGGQ